MGGAPPFQPVLRNAATLSEWSGQKVGGNQNRDGLVVVVMIMMMMMMICAVSCVRNMFDVI